MSKCATHGPRDIAVHSSAHHATLARHAVRIPLLNSAAIAGVVSLVVNTMLETPMFVRSIYKICRKRKFNKITEVEYKRCIIQELVQCFCIVLTPIVFAAIGQILIPVPFLGGIIGGIVGVVIGQLIGSLFGWLIARVIRPEKAVSLPIVVNREALSV